MQTYGERRQETRNQQFLTNRAGFTQVRSRKAASRRRRDKQLMHRRQRRCERQLANAEY